MKYCIPFIALILTGCNNSVAKLEFKNKTHYSIKIGDTLEIYHSTNSCCQYCQPNSEKLQHLDYIGRKIVVPEKKGCKGCNHTSALMFVAKSVGIDTIKDAIIIPLSNCNDTIKGLTKYIIQIK